MPVLAGADVKASLDLLVVDRVLVVTTDQHLGTHIEVVHHIFQLRPEGVLIDGAEGGQLI